jgi:hypothetical protein
MTNAMSMAELVRTCFMTAPPDVFHHEMVDGMNDREVRPQMHTCQRN